MQGAKKVQMLLRVEKDFPELAKREAAKYGISVSAYVEALVHDNIEQREAADMLNGLPSIKDMLDPNRESGPNLVADYKRRPDLPFRRAAASLLGKADDLLQNSEELRSSVEKLAFEIRLARFRSDHELGELPFDPTIDNLPPTEEELEAIANLARAEESMNRLWTDPVEREAIETTSKALLERLHSPDGREAKENFRQASERAQELDVRRANEAAAKYKSRAAKIRNSGGRAEPKPPPGDDVPNEAGGEE